MGRLIEGWHTSNRAEAFNLAHAIDLLESECRRNGSNLPPYMMRSRVELMAFARNGAGPPTAGTISRSAASGSAEHGTRAVPQSDEKAIMRVEDAANRLGVSASLVRRHCRAGKLPAVRFGKLWQIDAAALEAILKTKELAK